MANSIPVNLTPTYPRLASAFAPADASFDFTATMYAAAQGGGNRPPRPQDFGGTDHAAVMAAINYAAANIGEVLFDTLYELDDDIVIDSPLILRGAGDAMLDFSSRADFAKGYDDSLISFRGTTGTKVALTIDAKPAADTLLRPVSVTRSGTVLTFETNRPHGFSVGDPVWTFGGSSATASGQRVFYTQNLAGSSATRTIPLVVASVADSTHFTAACEDTGDAALSGTLYIYRADDVIFPSGGVAGFSVDQRLLIVSEATRTDGGSENIRIGEYQTIARILPTIGALLLHSAVRDTYLVSDTAALIPVSMILRPRAEGFILKSKGRNTGSGYGDRGLLFKYCESPVSNLIIRGVDQIGVNAWSCLGGSTTINMTFDALDEAGMASNALDIQYGAVVSMATEGHVTKGCQITGGRHAAVHSGTSTANNYGVVRGWQVESNHFIGQWLASIATHQSVASGKCVNNFISGAQAGINLRAGEWLVQGNSISAFQYGIYLYNEIDHVVITDNPRINGGIYGIYFYGAISTDALNGPVEINRNSIFGGERGVHVYFPEAGSSLHVEINDNLFSGQSGVPIEVEVGAGSGDGWQGSISRNTIKDNSGVNYAIGITNGIEVRADDNNILGDAATFTRAVYVDGGASGTVRVTGTIYPAASSEVTYVTGSAANDDLPVTSTLTIASGVITMTKTNAICVIAVSGEGAASDDLVTITPAAGATAGQLILLRTAANAQDITVKNTGNIKLATGFSTRVLDNSRDTLLLRWDVSTWNEISFSDVGA